MTRLQRVASLFVLVATACQSPQRPRETAQSQQTGLRRIGNDLIYTINAADNNGYTVTYTLQNDRVLERSYSYEKPADPNLANPQHFTFNNFPGARQPSEPNRIDYYSRGEGRPLYHLETDRLTHRDLQKEFADARIAGCVIARHIIDLDMARPAFTFANDFIDRVHCPSLNDLPKVRILSPER